MFELMAMMLKHNHRNVCNVSFASFTSIAFNFMLGPCREYANITRNFRTNDGLMSRIWSNSKTMKLNLFILLPKVICAKINLMKTTQSPLWQAHSTAAFNIQQFNL